MVVSRAVSQVSSVYAVTTTSLFSHLYMTYEVAMLSVTVEQVSKATTSPASSPSPGSKRKICEGDNFENKVSI